MTYRNGAPIYDVGELARTFGPVLRDEQCTCCNRTGTLYVVRYPDRDTLFVCLYCDTEREK